MFKVSVNEVFMHYFEKMSLASGGCAPRPQKLCHLPLLTPGKKSCVRPCTQYGYHILLQGFWLINFCRMFNLIKSWSVLETYV